VTKAPKRSTIVRLVEHRLDGAAWRVASHASARPAGRAQDQLTMGEAADVLGDASLRSKRICAAAGTFISTLTVRTVEISRTTNPSRRGRPGRRSLRMDRPARADQPSGLGAGEVLPDLLADERHHRVQEMGDLAEHPGGDGARLPLAASSAPVRIGFENSMYQSQKLPTRTGRARPPPR